MNELKGSIITFDIVFLEANVTKINFIYKSCHPNFLSSHCFRGKESQCLLFYLKYDFTSHLALIMNFAS